MAKEDNLKDLVLIEGDLGDGELDPNEESPPPPSI
jgi:hypothetical protein